MIFLVGDKPGNGAFKCIKCGYKQNLSQKSEILKTCLQCGGDSFEGSLIFERTLTGLKEKWDESITLLEISTFLCDVLRVESFINVVAVQLRVILCDYNRGKDNSLIFKITEEPEIHPCRNNNFIYPIQNSKDDKMILPDDLFDKTQTVISVSDWLSQEVIWNKNEKPITIGQLIKATAEKQGGAHIDSEMKGTDFEASILSRDYLIEIAKYIIDFSGNNYYEDVKTKLFDKIVSKFKDWDVQL